MRDHLRWFARLTALTLLAGMTTVTATAEPAAAAAAFTSTMIGQGSGSCADVPNGSTTNGTQLQLYSCWGGTNQNFGFTPVTGTAGQYNVRTVAASCLDVSGSSTADNASVVQWTCHANNNQRFRLQPVAVSGATNTFNLVAVHSGKCVAPRGDATANTTQLVQLPCSAATSRVWRIPGYTAGDGGSGALPSSFQWSSSGQLIAPKSDSSHTIAGIKDPSVVYSNGKWHVFASTASASGYNLVYLNFTDWSQAASATHYYLDRSPLGTGYRAAPQIFYFAPQGLWYLVYQTGNASFSTNADISNPNGWTAPRHFYSGMPQIIRDNIGSGYWVDMWVICDGANCYLFSSDDNGHLYRSETTQANFPNGMTNTVIAAQDANRNNLFEASNVYKVQGSNQYLLIVEAIGTDGRRWFRSWTAPAVNGTWTPLAASESNPFARANNTTFSGTPWTRDISHGELIRTGVDQTLTISPCQMRYLYQGLDPNAGGDYNSLPWRLGLLTQTNSTC